MCPQKQFEFQNTCVRINIKSKYQYFTFREPNMVNMQAMLGG